MKQRVLIFEDDDRIRSTLKDRLEEIGYEVRTFSNPGMCPLYYGTDQNCLLDYPCSDILISDINMPFETGLELIENLLKKGCKVKFRALMSADWTDSDLQYAEKLGCKIFSKPLDVKELLDWLENWQKKIDPKRMLSDWPGGK